MAAQKPCCCTQCILSLRPLKCCHCVDQLDCSGTQKRTWTLHGPWHGRLHPFAALTPCDSPRKERTPPSLRNTSAPDSCTAARRPPSAWAHCLAAPGAVTSARALSPGWHLPSTCDRGADEGCHNGHSLRQPAVFLLQSRGS